MSAGDRYCMIHGWGPCFCWQYNIVPTGCAPIPMGPVYVVTLPPPPKDYKAEIAALKARIELLEGYQKLLENMQTKENK